VALEEGEEGDAALGYLGVEVDFEEVLEGLFGLGFFASFDQHAEAAFGGWLAEFEVGGEEVEGADWVLGGQRCVALAVNL